MVIRRGEKPHEVHANTRCKPTARAMTCSSSGKLIVRSPHCLQYLHGRQLLRRPLLLRELRHEVQQRSDAVVADAVVERYSQAAFGRVAKELRVSKGGGAAAADRITTRTA